MLLHQLALEIGRDAAGVDKLVEHIRGDAGNGLRVSQREVLGGLEEDVGGLANGGLANGGLVEEDRSLRSSCRYALWLCTCACVDRKAGQ